MKITNRSSLSNGQGQQCCGFRCLKALISRCRPDTTYVHFLKLGIGKVPLRSSVIVLARGHLQPRAKEGKT